MSTATQLKRKIFKMLKCYNQALERRRLYILNMLKLIALCPILKGSQVNSCILAQIQTIPSLNLLMITVREGILLVEAKGIKEVKSIKTVLVMQPAISQTVTQINSSLLVIRKTYI